MLFWQCWIRTIHMIAKLTLYGTKQRLHDNTLTEDSKQNLTKRKWRIQMMRSVQNKNVTLAMTLFLLNHIPEKQTLNLVSLIWRNHRTSEQQILKLLGTCLQMCSVCNLKAALMGNLALGYNPQKNRKQNRLIKPSLWLVKAEVVWHQHHSTRWRQVTYVRLFIPHSTSKTKQSP